MGAAGPLPRLPAQSAAVAAGRLHGTRQWHDGGNCGPAGSVLLHQQMADAGCGAADGGFPPVHHLDVPAGGTAGMERGLRLHHGLPVPRLPELERIRPVEHVAALAGSRHRRRVAVLPGARQPPTGPGLRSCRRCASTPATGRRPCRGLRSRRRGEARPDHHTARAIPSIRSIGDVPTTGRRHAAHDAGRLADDAQARARRCCRCS